MSTAGSTITLTGPRASATPAPTRRPRAFLAAVGDPNDPVTWSGTPYHFLQHARAARMLDEGLPLSTTEPIWRLRRGRWNLSRTLTGDRPGGYQYSDEFQERLWRPHRARIRDGVVMTCFQLFPSSVVGDPTIAKWFFIDQTLLQLFDHYGQRQRIGRRVAREALAREREGYHAAAGIIAHSGWAAASVVADYGVPPERVHVVPQAANLDPAQYERWEQGAEDRLPARLARRELRMRLVFVGKDWARKGLDRLLAALTSARRQGFRGSLTVIGCDRRDLPSSLRSTAGVEWLGFLDKRRDTMRFLQVVGDADVGCLLSRAEAGGIALSEYHAVGLVVLGTDAGGAPDQLIPEASIVVPATADAEDIGRILVSLENDPARMAAYRAAAWRRRRDALWPDRIRRILQFWPY